MKKNMVMVIFCLLVLVLGGCDDDYDYDFTEYVTISFNKNGGSGTGPGSLVAETYSTIRLPGQGNLLRTGYTFGGWNTNSSGTGANYAAGSNFTVSYNDITLYAKWNSSTGGGGGTGTGTEASPYPLTLNTWYSGYHSSTTSGSSLWYSFSATSGTYYVWWNDRDEGDGSKTLDVKVTIKNTNGTNVFTTADSGWTSPKAITVTTAGTVKIQVLPYFSGNTGSYGVAYSTTSSRPPVPGSAPCTVTYDLNGGNGTPPAPQTGASGTNITLPSGTGLSKDGGYIFDGWNTSSNGTGTNYSASSSYRLSSNITLYAKWTPIYYTVAYDANGGNGSMEDSTFTRNVEQALRVNAFTRPGYIFLGWAMSSDGELEYTNGETVSLSETGGVTITLYALWTDKYTIIYHANGGDGEMEDSSIPVGASRNLQTNAFTRPGNVFGGWALTPDGAAQYTDGQNVNLTLADATVNLYAVWIGNPYTVAYDSNGGDGGYMAPSDFRYDVLQPLRKNTFTRTNYSFIGWARTATGDVFYADEESVGNLTPVSGGTVTLFAIWAHTYTVEYNSNGGDGGYMSDSLFTYGVLQALPGNAYTRTNYSFIGWATTETATTPQYRDKQSVGNLTTTAGDTFKLYAVWAPAYTVIYDRNGGSGNMANSNFTYGVGEDLRKNTFTRTYYSFIGWAKTASATTAAFADEQNVSDLSNVPGAEVRLYAVWRGIPYTVTYNANGGVGTIASSQFNYGRSQALTLNTNAITRTGYTFAGWSKSSTATTAEYSNGQSVSDLTTTSGATVPLYAVWRANTYTVAYNANGGDGNMDSTPFTYDQPGNLRVCTDTIATFSLVNYAFQGWATTEDGPVVYTNGQSVNNLTSTQDGIVTLYAKWAYRYDVYYNNNGGNGSMLQSNFVDGVEQALRKSTLNRDNYVFVGWATSDSGPMEYTDEQRVINLPGSTAGGIVTLYAVWAVRGSTFTVVYNINYTGGTSNMQNSPFTNGGTQTLRKNTYTRANYVFAGWALSATGTVVYRDEQSGVSGPANGTVNLYAVWTGIPYTVAYNANGGTGTTMANSSFIYGTSQALRLNTYTRPGYTFAGWSTSSTATTATYTDGASVSDLTTTSTVTLYAVWTGKTYTVVYDRNGGTGGTDMSNSTFTYGSSAYLKTNTYTRTGYTFGGWAISPNGDLVYTDGQYVSNLTTEASVTLYAVWGTNYTVVYDRNGGTGGSAMADTVFVYGVAQALRTNTYTRESYTFLGWARTPTATSAEFSNGQSVMNLAATGTVTLYAVWGTTFTENFESGGGISLTGWTFVNGSQTNKWFVGTATANGGSRSCYISNNSSANSYTITSTSAVHFYRDFNNVASISFDYKVQGETYSGSALDRLIVYLVDTSITPVAGSTLTSSTPLGTYCMQGTTWKRATINVSGTGAKRLVFTWYNDSSIGTQPPAAIDNVTVTFR
jgi:uncharacterized repeat protein (TIGR02543 family)